MMISSAADYQTRLGLEFTPSHFQVAVFDWVLAGRGHAVVKAVAGAGKSETVRCVVRLLTVPVLVLAFNKDVKDAMAVKLKGSNGRSSTVHGHGYACVRFHARGEVTVDNSKYRKMIDHAEKAIETRGKIRGLPAFTPGQRVALKADGLPSESIIKLINLSRLDCIDIDGDHKDFGDHLMEIADMHGLNNFDECLDQLVIDIVKRCLLAGADTWNTVDYTDMVWLPVVNGWTPRRYAWIAIDEAQDLSRCALALICKSLYSGGRCLFVGDPAQAIYAFAGADAESFQRIIDQTNATVLPLDVCYRCPESVLDVARAYVPEIQAREGAPAGIVRSATRSDYISEARDGDLILCRRNAPLLTMCFALIAEGIPAIVRGRAIAEGLVKIVEKVCSGWEYSNFRVGLDAWETKQVEVARKRSKDVEHLAARTESIGDKAECLRVIYSRSDATRPVELMQSIRDLFSDENGTVTLSSIHRAKGLEADRVVIMERDRLLNPPQRRGVDQEDELAYVAFTRAKSEMVYLDDDAPEAPAPKPTRDDETDAVEDIPPTPIPAAQRQPAALPSVDADAPDTYHPNIRPSRVALARMLDAALRGQGFTATSARGTRETVYTLTVAPGHDCLVYSTIVDGACRGLGEDSIKVCLVNSSGAKTRGIGKARRVNRVGLLAAIVGRVQSRVDGLRK